MSQIVKAALTAEIAGRNAHEVISGQRVALADAVRAKVAAGARQIGVSVVDVRLKRVDYIDQINASIFDRMKAERLRAANEMRAAGAAEGEQLKADADRQRTVMVAEAFRDAEKIKGDGDAKASQIYAQAFGKNPEFYRFYRSMEAYRATFKNRSDVIVLDSNSEFFKYFRNPGTGK
jgi:membrane protease subunit HflC